MQLRDFVGIPFKDRGRDKDGCDCWGLCMLYYREILGIEINDFFGSAYGSGKVFSEYKAQIEKNWIKLEAPKKHCIVGMANNIEHPGIITHFGIYLAPGQILHVEYGFHSRITRHTPAIKGYYEWQN